jgi:glucose-1-phosphate cytidylyltransferase
VSGWELHELLSEWTLKVVILCGGYGSRIRDVADSIPKPLIPIGPYPIVWHIMKYYASFGYRDFVLCLGYKGDAIRDFFVNYEMHMRDATVTLGENGGVRFHGQHGEEDWTVTLAETGLDSMTGARVRKIENYLGDDGSFMLTYGDGLGDVDIPSLVQHHRASGRAMTVTGVRPPGRFGEIEANEDGQVCGFNEKPQAQGGRISGGFFVCNRRIFEYLEGGDDLVLEREPMMRLVRDGEMGMFEHDGFWQPMDTGREYRLLNDVYRSGKAPWVR